MRRTSMAVPNREASIKRLRADIKKADKAHGGFNSSHEAFGVLTEELYELLAAIHYNSAQAIAKESLQVSSVALRLFDTCERAMDAGCNDAFSKRSGFKARAESDR